MSIFLTATELLISGESRVHVGCDLCPHPDAADNGKKYCITSDDDEVLTCEFFASMVNGTVRCVFDRLGAKDESAGH